MQPRRHSLPVANSYETTGDHEIVFYDWGDVDAKHVLICVHGLTRNARDFDAIAQAFVEKGRRVFAINMAGRGESAWLKNPEGYSYPSYVADCIAIMDNFHLRGVEWLGTSMGGLIGMMIAAMHPGRIKKLVLNDIGTRLSKEALARIYAYVNSMPKNFENRAEASAYLAEAFKPFGITDPVQWEKFVDSSLLSDAQGKLRYACDPAILTPVRELTKNFTEIAEVNLTALWEEVNIPSLIIHGADSDVLSTDTVRLMRASNARAESATIQGVGHAPALMDPEQIHLVTRWMTAGNATMLASGL